MSRFKTELCNNLMELGSCKYGDRCHYAHGAHELRQTSRRHPKYRTEKCKNFELTGKCPFGPRCSYVHPKPDLDSMVEQLTRYVRHTRAPKPEPDPDYFLDSATSSSTSLSSSTLHLSTRTIIEEEEDENTEQVRLLHRQYRHNKLNQLQLETNSNNFIGEDDYEVATAKTASSVASDATQFDKEQVYKELVNKRARECFDENSYSPPTTPSFVTINAARTAFGNVTLNSSNNQQAQRNPATSCSGTIAAQTANAGQFNPAPGRRPLSTNNSFNIVTHSDSGNCHTNPQPNRFNTSNFTTDKIGTCSHSSPIASLFDEPKENIIKKPRLNYSESSRSFLTATTPALSSSTTATTSSSNYNMVTTNPFSINNPLSDLINVTNVNQRSSMIPNKQFFTRF